MVIAFMFPNSSEAACRLWTLYDLSYLLRKENSVVLYMFELLPCQCRCTILFVSLIHGGSLIVGVFVLEIFLVVSSRILKCCPFGANEEYPFPFTRRSLNV